MRTFIAHRALRGTFRWLLPLVCIAGRASAQNDIENVIVETYYISDANDATDETGGGLAAGSRTYRIFLDLCDSCALRSIYGDATHAMDISSTAVIFNNIDRGKTYGYQINNNALDQNTVALDSWLSLGAASNALFGVLKPDDPDGTILNTNDGGSANIPGGLLANADADAGVPLTQKDGLMPGTSPTLPPNFIVQGITPDSIFKDSTLYQAFASSNTNITCSTPGVKGPTPDNRILIAQITTTGELSFHLNVQVEKPNGDVIRYVATDTLLTQGETPNGLLTYPPQCGCTDPNYLEYDPTAGCDDGSCATAIIFGCLDPAACNYSSFANFNVPALCCYGPDSCNGLDISLVCPTYAITEPATSAWALEIGPNPVNDALWLWSDRSINEPSLLVITDRAGRVMQQEHIDHMDRARPVSIDVAALAPGVYVLQLANASGRLARIVVKY